MRTLNNLTSAAGRFDHFLGETNLLQFLSEHLQANTMEDDIMLEVIIFVGAICSERNATKIAEAGLVTKMINVFLRTRKDYEIILQLLYSFGQFLLYESTRTELLAPDNKVVVSILELSQDLNKVVASLAETVLNAVVELDSAWCVKVKRLKFANHNMSRPPVLEEFCHRPQTPC